MILFQNMKLLRIFLFSIFLLCGLAPLQLTAQNPDTEVRAAWLTTNWNLDWPSAGLSPENQQKQLGRILDQLQAANFNTILFQVRVRGDVFFQSKIEPWSPFFTKDKTIGSITAYDPLAYAIQECHKRGLECHAWIVTFPLGSKKQVKEQGKSSVVARYPQLCKLYKDEWYLDPGNPDARKHILSVVDEIVSNYDVDGVHFDYIRYPEAAGKFPDKDTFSKYGGGESLQEWRRDNISTLVSDIYDQTKEKKPWVQVSCSPIGRYKDLNPLRGTWTAYSSVHQDAGKWMMDGKMDAVYPMMYYNEAEFGTYVEEWVKTSNGRWVVPGLGAYRLMPSEGNWRLKDITDQIDFIRTSNAVGAAYYRVGNVLENTKGLKDGLVPYYSYPAKLPSMKWLDNVAPLSPINMQVYQSLNGITTIEWESSDLSEGQVYTVYESSTEDFNIKNVKTIVASGLRANKLQIQTPDVEEGVYYSVTASDRFHNESVPCFPVYYIFSRSLEK